MQPNLNRNSTTTTRQDKKIEQNDLSLLINHQRLTIYASLPQTHRILNQLYHIKLQTLNPKVGQFTVSDQYKSSEITVNQNLQEIEG